MKFLNQKVEKMQKIKIKCDRGVFLMLSLALISLWRPLFAAKMAGALKAEPIQVMGWELCSFSPWGYAVILVPVALLLIMVFHEKIPYIYPTVFALVFAGLFGHNVCMLAASEWIYSNADGFIRVMRNIFLYPVLLVAAGFRLMLYTYDGGWLLRRLCFLDDNFEK